MLTFCFFTQIFCTLMIVTSFFIQFSISFPSNFYSNIFLLTSFSLPIWPLPYHLLFPTPLTKAFWLQFSQPRIFFRVIFPIVWFPGPSREFYFYISFLRLKHEITYLHSDWVMIPSLLCRTALNCIFLKVFFKKYLNFLSIWLVFWLFWFCRVWFRALSSLCLVQYVKEWVDSRNWPGYIRAFLPKSLLPRTFLSADFRTSF